MEKSTGIRRKVKKEKIKKWKEKKEKMRRDKEGGGEFLKKWRDQISIWKLPDAGSSFHEKDRTTAKVDTYKGIIEHRDIQRILQRPRTFLGNNWEPPQLSFSFIRANLIFWWRCQFGKPTHYITVVARPSFKFLDILWFDLLFIYFVFSILLWFIMSAALYTVFSILLDLLCH